MVVVNKVTWRAGPCAGATALASIGVAEPRQILRVGNHLFPPRAAITFPLPFRTFLGLISTLIKRILFLLNVSSIFYVNEKGLNYNINLLIVIFNKIFFII